MTSQSRLIFLDVGGHLGQTLDEVLCGCYTFDVVHTFEPMVEFADRLRQEYRRHVKSGRLIVHTCGLSNRNAAVTLFGANDGGGASLCKSKQDISGECARSTVQVVRTSDFFDQHLSAYDRIIMKLNCEGAEGEILLDLVESDHIHWLDDVMIDFDLFKVKGRRHEPFEVLRRLQQAGFSDFHLALDAMIGPSHRDRIRNWLSYVNQKTPISRVPNLFEGLPRQRPLLKRAMKTMKHRTFGALDAARHRRAS